MFSDDILSKKNYYFQFWFLCKSKLRQRHSVRIQHENIFIIISQIKHRNKPVMAYKEPWLQENELNKFFTVVSKVLSFVGNSVYKVFKKFEYFELLLILHILWRWIGFNWSFASIRYCLVLTIPWLLLIRRQKTKKFFFLFLKYCHHDYLKHSFQIF